MKQYNCIVFDDQEEGIDLIKVNIDKIPQLNLTFSSNNSPEFFSYLDRNKPDIMFMDVKMPEITGIDLFENFAQRWGQYIPKVVLTTKHIESIPNGLGTGVSDYIVKPVTYKCFRKAIDRIIDNLEYQNNKSFQNDFFFADIGDRKLKINFNDIVYIEGVRNYIIVITHEKKHIVYRSMKSMMDILPPNDFIRIHKSYLISINKIDAIQNNKFIFTVKEKEVLLPVGLTYKSTVNNMLNI